jgi:hypothetical protein
MRRYDDARALREFVEMPASGDVQRKGERPLGRSPSLP